MKLFIKFQMFLFFIIPYSAFTNGQDSINVIAHDEILLKEYFDTLTSIVNDNEKLKLNKKIDSIFYHMLKNENSFFYPFDSLKYIGKLTSADNTLRIFTWNIPLKDGTHRYFGYIHYRNKKEKKYKVFKLTENEYDIRERDTSTFQTSDWYGALYYEIIETKFNKTRYYTLLGFDFNSIFTKKKLIDVLFIRNDQPCFGKPIFKYKDKLVSRIIFEYAVRTNMTLKYDESMKMIVFDHLSPSKPSFEGKYQFYGPDFSYDGLKFEDGYWIHQKDLSIHN